MEPVTFGILRYSYISSQSKLKLRRKRRTKIVKIYVNEDQISKHRHGHNPYFKLDELLTILRIVTKKRSYQVVEDPKQQIRLQQLC